MRSQWLAGKSRPVTGPYHPRRPERGRATSLPAAVRGATVGPLRAGKSRLGIPLASPASGVCGSVRHIYLAEADRTSILLRLDKVDRFTITELGELLADHEEARI